MAWSTAVFVSVRWPAFDKVATSSGLLCVYLRGQEFADMSYERSSVYNGHGCLRYLIREAVRLIEGQGRNTKC